MKFVGIDLGLTGAIAALNHNGTGQVADLPVIETAAGKRIHGRGLLDILREFVPAGEACIVVMEDVRPRSIGNGGAATNSMFSQGSLMRSRGIAEAVCDIAGVRVEWTQPQSWKRHFSLLTKRQPGEDAAKASNRAKEAGRQMAITLMPGMAPALARKLDHNRADALLMAHWARSTLG